MNISHNVNSERSSSGGVLGASGSEIIGYKSQPPNNTIMIRGLAQHITENDVRRFITRKSPFIVARRSNKKILFVFR